MIQISDLHVSLAIYRSPAGKGYTHVGPLHILIKLKFCQVNKKVPKIGLKPLHSKQIISISFRVVLYVCSSTSEVKFSVPKRTPRHHLPINDFSATQENLSVPEIFQSTAI